jgi:hypothetical protein
MTIDHPGTRNTDSLDGFLWTIPIPIVSMNRLKDEEITIEEEIWIS